MGYLRAANRPAIRAKRIAFCGFGSWVCERQGWGRIGAEGISRAQKLRWVGSSGFRVCGRKEGWKRCRLVSAACHHSKPRRAHPKGLRRSRTVCGWSELWAPAAALGGSNPPDQKERGRDQNHSAGISDLFLPVELPISIQRRGSCGTDQCHGQRVADSVGEKQSHSEQNATF